MRTALHAITALTTLLTTPQPADLREQLQHLVDAGAPAAVMTVRNDGADTEVAAGVGDRRTGAKGRPDDRYRIASLTKTFTAVVVLRLVAERKLTLDATVSQWLQGVPGGDEITVRRLLQQNSGLPEYKAQLAPKTSTEYQDRRYERHLHGYMPSDRQGAPDSDSGRLVDFTEQTVDSSAAAGGMISNGPDVATFLRALFTGRLLQKALLDQMTRVIPPPSGNPFPWVKGYGLGLFKFDFGCGVVYGHIGGTRGYTGLAASTPDGRRQAVIGVSLEPSPAQVRPASVAAITKAVCG
jgi:D-alanyl-D-alanine carboxypeptidase